MSIAGLSALLAALGEDFGRRVEVDQDKACLVGSGQLTELVAPFSGVVEGVVDHPLAPRECCAKQGIGACGECLKSERDAAAGMLLLPEFIVGDPDKAMVLLKATRKSGLSGKGKPTEDDEEGERAWHQVIEYLMPNIAWAKSYEAAVKSARASNKLILVDFYTDW